MASTARNGGDMRSVVEEISNLLDIYNGYREKASRLEAQPIDGFWECYDRNIALLEQARATSLEVHALIHQLECIEKPSVEPFESNLLSIIHCTDLLTEASNRLNHMRDNLISHIWKNHTIPYIDIEITDPNIFRSALRNVAFNTYVRSIKCKVACQASYSEIRNFLIDILNNDTNIFSIELTGQICFDGSLSEESIIREALTHLPREKIFFIKISNKSYITSPEYSARFNDIALDPEDESQLFNDWKEVYYVRDKQGKIGSHDTREGFMKTEDEYFDYYTTTKRLEIISNLTNEELSQDTGNLPYIFRAAQQSDLMCLQYLLNRGIAFNRACKVTDPNTGFEHYTNIAHLASQHAGSDVLELLSTLDRSNILFNKKLSYIMPTGQKTSLNALEATILFRKENVLETVKSLFSLFNFGELEENLINIALERGLYDVVICLLKQKAPISEEAKRTLMGIVEEEDPDQNKQMLACFLKETLTPFQIIKDAGDESRMRALQEELGKLAKEYRISPETMIEAAKKEIKTKPINDFIQWHKEHPLRDINAYRDLQNQSLLYCAYNKKAHSIYGYLLANGAKLARHERINRASEEAFQPFKDATEHFFEQRINIALFLASHTHISPSFKDSVDPVTLYQSLTKTSGDFARDFILPILNVFRFVDADFKIMVDPNHETIAHLSGSAIKGRFMSRPYRVYVGSQNDRKLMQGTLIHELTHFACFIACQNGCLPYKQEGEEDKKAACNTIYDSMSDTELIKRYNSNPYLTYFSNENFWKKYPEKETDQSGQEIGKLKRIKELIVRIPQTLLVYGQDGLEALQKHAPKLLDYYQSTFIPDCVEYVKTKEMEARTALVPSSPKRATLQPKATEEPDSSSERATSASPPAGGGEK